MTAGAGGTVSASPTGGAAGTVVTLSNSPASGYAFSHYTVNGSTIAGNTFTLTGNATVKGVFSAVVPTGVTLSPSALSLTAGGTATLTATVSPADAVNKAVTWSTGNAAVAAVNQSGAVTAVGPGTATISVTTAEGGYSAVCAVTVTQQTSGYVAPTGVSLGMGALSLTVGVTVNLTATVSPANATNKTVFWSTGNAAIAMVDQNGAVTAVAPGTTIITATTANGGKTATCNVTVGQNGGATVIYYWVNEQNHLSLSGASATVSGTGSLTITAQGTGYTGQHWYLNGIEDLPKAGQASYTFSGAGKPLGYHTVGLRAAKGGGYYYTEITVLVTN
jgi:uncharacterized protein YjdB